MRNFEVFPFENMDVATELASLDFEFDWDEINILDDVGTPSLSNSACTLLHNANISSPNQGQQDLHSRDVETLQIENNEEPGAELAAAPTIGMNLLQDLTRSIARNNQALTTEATSSHSKHAISSNHENLVAPLPVLDDHNPSLQLPDFAAPLPSETLFGHPSQSVEGLISEGTNSPIEDQDMNPVSYINQFYQSRNANLHMIQGVGIPNQYNTSNQLLIPNIIANNTFNGINNQTSYYPALIHENHGEAGAGIYIGIANGQFMGNQRTILAPLPNQLIDPHSVWNPRPQHNAANAYDSQHTPSYMQPPQQQFTTLGHQVSHASEMHRVFDVRSQHSMQPIYPTYPRVEAYSHLQSAFASMPSNAYDRQHGYGPLLPVLAVPSRPAMYPNNHAQHFPFAMTSNSLGSGSSMPLRYPQLHGHLNNHYGSQAMMIPSSHRQKGNVVPVQFSGNRALRVSNLRNGNNGVLNIPSFQPQSSTLHGPSTLPRPTISPSQSSRVLEPLGTRITEGMSSQVLNSRASVPAVHSRAGGSCPVQGSATQVSILNRQLQRPEDAMGTQPQQAAPVLGNRVNTQRNREIIIGSSTSRAQPSVAILKIEDQNGEPVVTSSGPSSLNLQNRTGQQVPPQQVRPLKRLEVGDSSSSSKRQKMDSSVAENANALPKSQEANKTPENEKMEDQNDNTTNSFSTFDPRNIPNPLYDPAFRRMGLPVDPHLRSFKAHSKNFLD